METPGRRSWLACFCHGQLQRLTGCHLLGFSKNKMRRVDYLAKPQQVADDCPTQEERLLHTCTVYDTPPRQSTVTWNRGPEPNQSQLAVTAIIGLRPNHQACVSRAFQCHMRRSDWAEAEEGACAEVSDLKPRAQCQCGTNTDLLNVLFCPNANGSLILTLSLPVKTSPTDSMVGLTHPAGQLLRLHPL